jgi:hypothetical protein
MACAHDDRLAVTLETCQGPYARWRGNRSGKGGRHEQDMDDVAHDSITAEETETTTAHDDDEEAEAVS